MASKGLPEQLVSRYRRYKAGTAQVVQWLGRTAKEHCELIGRLAWLKDSEASVLPLKTRELLALAELIARSNPPLTVPIRLMEVLEDVIAGRQECSHWYSSQAIDEDTNLAKQNHSHAFLVTVLRKIQDHLKQLSPAEATAKKLDSDSAGKPDELKNLFTYLELEEPSEAPLGNSASVESAKEPITPKFVLEDQDNVSFALWCHLADLNETRLFLVDVWSEYCKGDVSIEVAGMVTETAFGMMRRTHEEFAAIYPKLDNWSSVINHLRLSTCTNRNAVYAFSKSPGVLSTHIRAGANPNDLTCLGAGMLLTTFWQGSVFAFESVVGAPPGQRQFSNAKVQVDSCVRPKTTLEGPLLSLLPELLSHKCYASQGILMVAQHHNETELTNGLLKLAIEGDEAEVPMWLAVATQVCMDVDRSMNSGRQLGGDAVLRTATRHRNVIDQSLRFYKEMQYKCFDGTNGHGLEVNKKRHLEEVKGTASTILDTLQMIRVYAQPEKRQRMGEQDKFNHLRAKALHPGLDVLPHCAGFISWRLKVQAYDVGCAASNEQSVVVILAHFYEMARKHGLVTAVWHDLEFVIERHSKKKPLITKTNENADPYSALRHFLIDLGVEVSAFAGRKQPTIPSDNVINTRGKAIKTSSGSDLLSAAREQFREDEQRGYERADAFDIALTVLTENSDPKMKPSKRKRHGKKQRFAANQLLSTLKTHLIADESNLNFDYFGFTEVCLGLLRLAVYSGCQNEKLSNLDTYRGRLYWLMKSAADAEAQSREVSKTPFAYAAAEMQKVVQTNGNRFSKEAYRLSSGTMSEDLRPTLSGALHDRSVALAELKAEYPDISVGSSCSTVELYDSAGSIEKFEEILRSGILDDLLVDTDGESVQTFTVTAMADA